MPVIASKPTPVNPPPELMDYRTQLLRILETEKPEYLAVAFDTGKTFRNDLSRIQSHACQNAG